MMFAMPNYIDRVSRAQHDNLRPIFRAILNHLGAISIAVGVLYLAYFVFDVLVHNFSRADALFSLALLPFWIMLIYLLVSSRSLQN